MKIVPYGFSLLEVLIALLILSLSLLTFAQAELTALRSIQNAYFINYAALQNSSLVERLRACDKQENCRNQEIQQWNAEIPSLLPQGKTTVDSKSNEYQIEIRWQDNSSKTILKEKLFARL